MKIKEGDVFKTNQGGYVTVLKYNNANSVLIKHEDSHGYTCITRSSQLRNGQVKNPYFPSVYGVGYRGVGPYKATSGSNPTKAYYDWIGMLRRSYCTEYKKSKPTYEDVYVDSQWHNFQNFAEWWANAPNSDRKEFSLDKDLRKLGNKVYSPDTCSYVPVPVNSLLNNHSNAPGEQSQGVRREGRIYEAALSVNSKVHYLGSFSNPDDAQKAYKTAKEEYVRKIAERYKDDLHQEVYKTLIEWTLEIT